MIRLAILALCLLAHQAQAAGFQPTRVPVQYFQWDALVSETDGECSKYLFDDLDTTPPDDPLAALQFVNAAMHQTFIYETDGISDIWCGLSDDLVEAFFSGGYWYGDCDEFMLTAAQTLRRLGFPAGDLFPVTTLGWYGRTITHANLSQYHPQAQVVDHAMLLVWVAGEWWVMDNTNSELRRGEEVFNEFNFIPYATLNLGNGKPNQWVRFWWNQ